MMKILLSLLFCLLIMVVLMKELIMMICQMYLCTIMMVYFIMCPLNVLNMWIKIYYNLGMDFYSLGLIMLTLWIVSLMIMASMDNLLSNNYYKYIMLIMSMMLILLVCFLSMNMLMFYMFFEASLIPIFLLVLGWGGQIERIFAGFMMMVYTLFGSMPLLYFIICTFKIYNSGYFNLYYTLIVNYNFIFYMMMMLAFFIKMPIYLVHSWLPKAHVESPLVGSMILAGVMLKLGSYGILRFMIIFKEMSLMYNKYFIIFSLMGGLFSSLICLYQIDMKMLVAYSSVVHMSMLISGSMTLMGLGYLGSFFMMLAHGLCSSGMFYLVNINYERVGSRSLMLNKGMINLFPSLSMFWFLMCSSNLSFPPSLNLFSEIMLISSLIMWDQTLMLNLIVILFFGASYSLYLYSYTQHGCFSNMLNFMSSVMIMDYFILLMHWIPLNLMFLMIYML